MIALLALSLATIALAYASDLRAVTDCMESMLARRSEPPLAGLTSLGIRSVRSVEAFRHLRDLPANTAFVHDAARAHPAPKDRQHDFPALRLLLIESAPKGLAGRLSAIVTRSPLTATFNRDAEVHRTERALKSAFASLMKEVDGASYRPELGGVVAKLESAGAILWVGYGPREQPGVGDIALVRAMVEELDPRLVQAATAKPDVYLALAKHLHDLGTPIANAKLALNSSELQGGPESIAVALRSLEAIERMLEDLVAFSTSGDTPLHLEVFDLTSMLSETVGEFSPAASMKGIALSVSGSQGPRFATADRSHVRRIVSNLLSNAVKVTPNGSITVSCECRLGKVVVRVKDSGPGLSDKQLATLFAPFSRPLGRALPGSGLGLFISRSLAERNGGALTATSVPGRGSEFVLTIPAAEISRSILIVEDDAELADSLARTFRSAGYRASVAMSVKEALCLLEDDAPSAIVTDWAMADGGGSRIVEAAPGSVPVIVLSGVNASSLEPLPERCAVLEKGCNPQELLDAVRDALSVSSRADAIESRATEASARGR